MAFIDEPPTPAPATTKAEPQHVKASDWADAMQAVYDLRTAAIGPRTLNLPKEAGEGLLVDSGYGWKDLLGDIATRQGGSSFTLQTWRGGIATAPFFNTNDEATLTFHMPHDYVPGTDVFLHVHWGHNGTAISGSLVILFGVTYAKAHNQAIFAAEVAPSITLPTPDIATVPRWHHRLHEFQLSSSAPTATQLDTALLEPDGVIMVGMRTTTIPTITGSAVGANGNRPAIFYVDLHYQSTGIGTKAKAPNFYL